MFAAVPLARRFGLVNTMVFTHLPANLFLVLAAFAPTAGSPSRFWSCAACCRRWTSRRGLLRHGGRHAQERPAAASLTAVPRSLASAVAR